MTSRERALLALLDQLEPAVAKAFRESMADWRDSIDLAAFTRAVQANDIEGAIAALNLDPAALQPLLSQLTGAFMTAGEGWAVAQPKRRDPATGARVVVRFDGRDLAAEQWLRTQSAALVTRITEGQRAAVRLALYEGLRAGDNPRQTALEIVGRVGANGKRQGGLIGLTEPQTEALLRAKAELAAGSPEGLRAYLGRKLRDKRYDAAVARAIDTGKAIPADTLAKMLTSYSNRLLKLRGDMLARTETLAALHGAEHAAAGQAIGKGLVQRGAVTKTWRTAHDRRVRHSHRLMEGQKRAFDQPFQTPGGALMMHPGDTKLGAPAGEVIGCRCVAPVRVNHLAGLR